MGALRNFAAKKLPTTCGPSPVRFPNTLPGGSATPRPTPSVHGQRRATYLGRRRRRRSASVVMRPAIRSTGSAEGTAGRPAARYRWPLWANTTLRKRRGRLDGGVVVVVVATSCRLPPSLAPSHPCQGVEHGVGGVHGRGRAVQLDQVEPVNAQVTA